MEILIVEVKPTNRRNPHHGASISKKRQAVYRESALGWTNWCGADKIGVLLAGMPFKAGMPAQGNPPEQQKLAD